MNDDEKEIIEIAFKIGLPLEYKSKKHKVWLRDIEIENFHFSIFDWRISQNIKDWKDYDKRREERS